MFLCIIRIHLTLVLLGHEGLRRADFLAVQQENVPFTEVMLCHIKAVTSGS